MSDAFARIRRAIRFAAYLPPRRMAWRAWLVLKRRILARTRRHRHAPQATAITFRGEGFAPLLSPAASSLEVTADELTFSFLGRTVRMGRTVCWHPDATPPLGQLWMMNLHYNEFLAGVPDPLFVELTAQWIAANPCYGPGYWRDAWHAYALSIRTIVWMEELARRGAGISLDAQKRICASIAEQLDFLARNIERDIGGNHLIKNIRALATGGRLFEGEPARRWTELACRLILFELDEHVLADGGHFERTPSYHGQVFGDLLAIRQALSQSGDVEQDLIGRIDAALQKMAPFVADIAHPDGLVPLFNDAGLNMAASPNALLLAFERIYGYRPVRRSSFAFPQSGFFGFRRDDFYLVVDCGALGADTLMAHAHGDALSFELSVDGKRVIVDQGVYEYEAGERRGASRSARFHNTVAIDGSDQAEFFGAFRCGARPRVELLSYEEKPEGLVLEGRHDGFSRLSGGPRHSRRFELTYPRLTIRDSLDPESSARVSSSLLIHPDFQIVQDGAHMLASNGDTRLSIGANVPTVMEPAVYWPDIGVEIPTRRLRFLWPQGARDTSIQIHVLRDASDIPIRS